MRESSAEASPPRYRLSRSHRGRWLQLFQPFDFEWNTLRLEIPNLPASLRGVRIIHLTDLHLRAPWYSAYDRLLDRIAHANADLLLFTGDFVDDKLNHEPALPSVYRFAKGMTARLGCYAVLGNHDRLHFGARLRETCVQLIGGERRDVAIGDAAIELIGLPGAIRADLPVDFAGSIGPKAADAQSVRIVLSHFPDHLPRVAGMRPDLFLAGHTHGGQVCLPGGMPIIKHDSLPRRLCTGVHRIGETWLVVGRGFGTTGLPIRVFCPPEVIEIELRAPGDL